MADYTLLQEVKNKYKEFRAVLVLEILRSILKRMGYIYFLGIKFNASSPTQVIKITSLFMTYPRSAEVVKNMQYYKET